MRKLILILLAPLTLVCAQASRGDDVITFDDLAPHPFGQPQIPNGYSGLNWSNFDYENGAGQPAGYNSGIVSPDNVAYNGLGQSATASISAGTFAFDSAYFTAAWNDGLQVTVQGYNGATLLDSLSFAVNTSGPKLETFDWSGLNELVLSSSGGTPNPYWTYFGGGTEAVVDNLAYVLTPEPSAFVLATLGIAGLLLAARRCKA